MLLGVLWCLFVVDFLGGFSQNSRSVTDHADRVGLISALNCTCLQVYSGYTKCVQSSSHYEN